MALKRLQRAGHCEADQWWGVSRRQRSNPQQHPDREQQIGCRLFFSRLRQPQRAHLSVLYLSSAASRPAFASSHSSSAWRGSLCSFMKIFIKKGEPDRKHCKRYLEDLESKLSWWTWLQNKTSGSAACRVAFLSKPQAADSKVSSYFRQEF